MSQRPSYEGAGIDRTYGFPLARIMADAAQFQLWHVSTAHKCVTGTQGQESWAEVKPLTNRSDTKGAPDFMVSPRLTGCLKSSCQGRPGGCLAVEQARADIDAS